MKKKLFITIGAMFMSLMTFALTPLTGSSICCVGSVSGCSADSLHDRGGVWSCSNTAIATVDSGYESTIGIVKGITPGVVTITYTLGGSYVTITVTVNATPAAISASATIMCVGSTATFSDATPGGTWISANTYIATIGTSSGIATGVHNGMTTIYYTILGCSATIQDTVIGSTTDSIYGPSIVCLGTTGTFSDVRSGGVWSSSNPAVATIGSSSGIATGISLGTAVLSYTGTGLCGPTYGTYTITVSNTTPTVSPITGASSVMLTGTTTLADATYGGTWSSSNTSVALIYSGNVSGMSLGTAVITYSLSGCGGVNYVTTPMTVTPYDEISGHVLFTGPSYTGSIRVYLITYNPATFDLQAIDSFSTYAYSATSIAYKFNAVPTDSFRVKAAHDTSSLIIGSTGYIPTYYTSSFYWYSANVFYHTSGTTDINKDITMGYGTITSGVGFIGGNVTTGANKGTAGATPAVGLQMYVINSAGAMVQQVQTDASGNYAFSNLPYDTYTIFPEALNYLTTAYTNITLSAAAPRATGAGFVQHTVSHTITPQPEGINNISPSISSVSVFPNPSNGKLNIQWNTIASETGAVTVSDVTGRDVYNTTMNMTQGTGVKQVDLSGLTNGVYIVSVKSNSVNYTNKVNIQH